jgi:hypothetical protein
MIMATGRRFTTSRARGYRAIITQPLLGAGGGAGAGGALSHLRRAAVADVRRGFDSRGRAASGARSYEHARGRPGKFFQRRFLRGGSSPIQRIQIMYNQYLQIKTDTNEYNQYDIIQALYQYECHTCNTCTDTYESVPIQIHVSILTNDSRY